MIYSELISGFLITYMKIIVKVLFWWSRYMKFTIFLIVVCINSQCLDEKVPAMKESIERVKETSERLNIKEEKLDDEINDTCDQLVWWWWWWWRLLWWWGWSCWWSGWCWTSCARRWRWSRNGGLTFSTSCILEQARRERSLVRYFEHSYIIL